MIRCCIWISIALEVIFLPEVLESCIPLLKLIIPEAELANVLMAPSGSVIPYCIICWKRIWKFIGNDT